jgi:hypothetical protein
MIVGRQKKSCLCKKSKKYQPAKRHGHTPPLRPLCLALGGGASKHKIKSQLNARGLFFFFFLHTHIHNETDRIINH